MFDLPHIEKKILKFWQEKEIFKKTLDKDCPKGNFVFYEGPPTANGKPGIHHVLARAFKDLIPRFKTMQGYKVDRKAGWDTHGLPVELEVEKKLGLSNKRDVEEYGMEEFNKKCKESVWQYKEDWEKMTERIGFWIDMQNPYITYNNDYIESLWWVVKQAHERGLLYQGHKVIPHCPRCGTALSSHEVAQGYKNIEEDSVYIKFKIKYTQTGFGVGLVFLNNKGQVLLGLRNEEHRDKVWALPGGKTGIHESFEEAAKREAQEELGVDIEIDKCVSLENEIFEGRLYKTATYVVKAAKGQQVENKIPNEIERLDWFDLDNLPDNIYIPSKNALKILAEGGEVKKVNKLKDEVSVLAWTTTPWTLPGNIALAVGEKVEYCLVKQGEEYLIIAKNLLNKLEGDYEVIREVKGKDLVGLEYEPLFPGVIKETDENYQNAFKVYLADFVSTEDGTGVVHTAVMYGIEDYELGEQIGLPKVHSVNLDGTFNELVPKWQGRFVKDVEQDITDDLKERDLLYRVESYTHDYPFCWRCDTPLIYYAKDSWFFKMSDLRDELIKNNQQINWVPEHIKEGRFGEWLKDVKDWAISRERYWGTPLPVWICQDCEELKVVGSRKELAIDSDFDLHRPYIDEVKLDCGCGGKMERTPEVMDCWFDSGAMPFAQWHYPFDNKDKIDEKEAFPADYISEAVDQTRGWFYTLLAIATILGQEAPYKNVICLGHILDKDGQKMSKSRGNVVDPWEMIHKYGADALRWHLYTMSQAGEPKRFDEKNLKESSRIFMTLLNVISFYKMFVGKKMEIRNLEIGDLDNILDKWINSKLRTLIKEVTNKLENYDITTAGRRIEEFINDLSTWYVRRSRDRFKGQDKEEKVRALKTLRCVIFNLNRLMAPFVPFVTEHIYQVMGGRKESVHLESWPVNQDREIDQVDQKVLDYMEMTRKIVELGLAKRAEHNIKVRQPLSELRITNYELPQEYLELVQDELNVKRVIQEKGAGDLGVELDTEITEELKKEGLLRDLVRAVNDTRKKMGLTINDKVNLFYNCSDKLVDQVVDEFTDELKRSVIAESVDKTDEELEKVKVGDTEVGIRLEKI